MNKILWHSLSEKEVFDLLRSSEHGLDSQIVTERQKKYGLNQLPTAKPLTGFLIFFNQFKSPMIYILIVAALVSLFLRQFADFWVISAAVIINTLVGFIQENRAEKTLAELKKIISYKSKVIREGREIYLDSRQLVVGDIIILESGEKIPADGRLLQVNNFQVNEAALTGESMPVSKEVAVLPKGTNLADRLNMVFMGTVVVRGRAKIIITGTGLNTYLGEIASLVNETPKEVTPLQIQLRRFSNYLGFFVLISCLFIFFLGLAFGEDFFLMFETAVAIAVAAIPEGLLVSLTIILTIGMQRILRQQALVKRLIAAETLGSVSVICSDKTGTLTEGKMRVYNLLTGFCDSSKDLLNLDQPKSEANLVNHLKLLTIGIICNNAIISTGAKGLAEEFVGDATEIAILKAGVDIGLDYQKLRVDYQRLEEIPFSTEIKYMATLNSHQQSNKLIYLKGAPEKILTFCNQILVEGEVHQLDHEQKNKINNNLEKLTSQGLRVLAVAYQEVNKDFSQLDEAKLGQSVFVGVLALKDPLRTEARSTIDLCKKAGIRPIIITGDHRLTVKAIAAEVGLDVKNEHILDGQDLDKLSDDELRKKVKDIVIYARVSPKHKLRIVDAWQANGQVVAMLGDGINDAPALRSADIGVALGSGTDVAKETADLVLLDDNFATIVKAIEQGRVIFDNIRKVIVYLLADCFTEMILIVGALLARLPLPITALQILYINIISDGFPNIALTFEPGDPDIMKKKPRLKNDNILNSEMKFLIFFVGIITDLVLFGLYLYLLQLNYDLGHIRTIIFTAMAFSSLLYVFSCKNLEKNIWQTNFFNNMYIWWAIILGVGLQLLILYLPFTQALFNLSPLDWPDWLVVIGLAFIKLIAMELAKIFYLWKQR